MSGHPAPQRAKRRSASTGAGSPRPPARSGKRATKAGGPPGPITTVLHLHIPRTAGSNVHDRLDAGLAGAGRCIAYSTEEALAAALADPAPVSLLTGHFNWGVHERFERFLYLVVLRDPVDRVASLYDFLGATPDGDQSLRYAAASFAEALSRDFISTTQFSNGQVRQLVGNGAAGRPTTKADLEAAWRNLCRPDVIVTFPDELEAGLLELSARLGRDIQPPTQVTNAADRKALSAEARRLATGLNRHDLELYRRARARFSGWYPAAAGAQYERAKAQAVYERAGDICQALLGERPATPDLAMQAIAWAMGSQRDNLAALESRIGELREREAALRQAQTAQLHKADTLQKRSRERLETQKALRRAIDEAGAREAELRSGMAALQTKLAAVRQSLERSNEARQSGEAISAKLRDKAKALSEANGRLVARIGALEAEAERLREKLAGYARANANLTERIAALEGAQARLREKLDNAKATAATAAADGADT